MSEARPCGKAGISGMSRIRRDGGGKTPRISGVKRIKGVCKDGSDSTRTQPAQRGTGWKRGLFLGDNKKRTMWGAGDTPEGGPGEAVVVLGQVGLGMRGHRGVQCWGGHGEPGHVRVL